MKSHWVVVSLLLTNQIANVYADERRPVVDLTTQQYRVESLQSEHYKLKQKKQSLKEQYNKQKTRVDSLEKSLAEAKKTLAANKAEIEKHDQTMKVFNKELAIEEQKLNTIWDKAHRR